MTPSAAAAERVRQILVQWQAGLNSDRASRARLRRCTTASEVMLEPSFARLLQDVFPGWTSGEHYKIAALARTVLVLAAAQGVNGQVSVAEAMVGTDTGRKSPIVSLLRADKLFRSDDADEACRVLRTLVEQVEAFDPADLYQAMLFWDTRRIEWAMKFNVAAHRLTITTSK